MMLQDRGYTRIIIVTLAETTPVLEAGSLQDDLRRASVEPYAWVINASLAAARPADPLLRCRAAAEISQIAKVKANYSSRVALIAFQAEEPIGATRLMELTKGSPLSATRGGGPL